MPIVNVGNGTFPWISDVGWRKERSSSNVKEFISTLNDNSSRAFTSVVLVHFTYNIRLSEHESEQR